MTKSREIINQILAATGNTQKSAASLMNYSPQQFGQKLNRNSLRLDEFLLLVDAVGLEMTLRYKDSGEVIKKHGTGKNGHGYRVRGMSDGITYDTATSDALSNSFYADGENEFDSEGTAQELYIDKTGHYFFAEYRENGAKAKIRAVPSSMAAMFIDKYGTDIEKHLSE